MDYDILRLWISNSIFLVEWLLSVVYIIRKKEVYIQCIFKGKQNRKRIYRKERYPISTYFSLYSIYIVVYSDDIYDECYIGYACNSIK